MLILLPIALLLVLGWIGWQSRNQPYLAPTCCHAKWPPTDLTGDDEHPPDAT